MRQGLRQFLFFVALVLIFIIAGKFFNVDLDQSREFFERLPIVFSSVIFVVLYVVGTFFIWFGPKDILRVASLFVFGVVWSTVLIYIGESLNMVALFWFSRRFGQPFIEQHARGRIREFKDIASHTSAPVIFFMKFYPIISFRFLDLGYGLTNISFTKYAIISLIASPLRLYVIQFFLDLMIRFGLALNKGMEGFLEHYVDLLYYLAGNPRLFLALSAYTFSSLIFFAVLVIRMRFKKKSASV